MPSKNEIILPADLLRGLPAGIRLFSFDGEVVYRGKNGNPFDGRIFSLLPVTTDPVLYERRYEGGQHVQEVYMPIENFHGHIATVFYFYIPSKETARTGKYRAESFAAMSWGTGHWIQVTSVPCIKSLIDGQMTQGQIGVAIFKTMLGGIEKRMQTNSDYAEAMGRIVAHLRNDLQKRMQQGGASARL